MDRAQLNARLQAFRDRCRSLGMAATVQRLAIYKALLQHHDHPSPDAVYRAARRAVPALSLATVYKTLDVFDRVGLARVVNPLHAEARYDARVDHHHHLVCVRCKRLDDVEASLLRAQVPRTLEAIGLPEAARRDFDVVDWQITFRGLCRACAGKKKARA